jgi:hypothetical protein
MNPYLIITGLCCSIIVSGLIPLFASPKVVIENKMKTQGKKDWGKHNSFQLRLKRDEQIRQIKEMEEKIRQEKEKESDTGQKRKRNKTRKRNKSKKNKTKRNKSKRNKSKRK